MEFLPFSLVNELNDNCFLQNAYVLQKGDCHLFFKVFSKQKTKVSKELGRPFEKAASDLSLIQRILLTYLV